MGLKARLVGQIGGLLGRTPLGLFPVAVRAGLAQGARWTLLPYSSYWRSGGGEHDIETVVASLPSLTGATCWDLGAHFGLYTIGFARLVGPTGHVASFEPDPIAFARCERHVRINSLRNVRLFNAAVSESAGQRPLILADKTLGSSANHLRYEDEPVSPDERTIDIETVVLDDLVASGAIRPPTLVKVDVEGHGAKALTGAIKTLGLHAPTVVMSFHSHAEANDTRAILEPLGYYCREMDGGEMSWPAVVFRTVRLDVRRGPAAPSL